MKIMQWLVQGGFVSLLVSPSVGALNLPVPPGGAESPPAQDVGCLASPVGFAALNGGTTGGSGPSAQFVTVRTGVEFARALSGKQQNRPLTIRVDGRITPQNSGGVSKFDIKDMSDVSVIGVGGNSVLDGIGIKIWRASNIIVRNLTIRNVRSTMGDGDGISIEGPASNVWIDHNTLHNRLDVDKDYYDGLIDITRSSNNISITYNYLHSSWKTSLSGHSDSNGDNNRRVTYAFNRWENVNSRAPLIRFNDAHIYNNYYNSVIDSGINSRMGARVRIENNVFENSRNPIVSCFSPNIGHWDVSDNIFNNIRWQSAKDCRIAGPNVRSTITYLPPYQYSVMPVNQVKDHVLRYAGAGRCDL